MSAIDKTKFIKDIKGHRVKKDAAVFFDVEKAFDTPIVEYRADDLAKGFLSEIKVQINPNNYFLTSSNIYKYYSPEMHAFYFLYCCC